jgi:hypothetical protein
VGGSTFKELPHMIIGLGKFRLHEGKGYRLEIQVKVSVAFLSPKFSRKDNR